MPAFFIPGTDRVVFLKKNNGDYVLNLKNYPEIDESIREEDIKIVGNWEDYSGSGTKGPNEVMLQGISDVDPSTPYGQLLASEDEKTDRGVSASAVRQRPRLITIEVN
jgi:hypothetical protein